MGKLFKIDNRPNFLKISNDRKLRLIELFAGYGSQAMALKRAGIPFEHHKVVEFDSYACDSYNAVHGTTFVPTDICTIHADDLEIVDTDNYTYLVTYSYPCQDLSVAGHQRGMIEGSGTRSSLLWEVKRILSECTNLPQVLMMENVPAVHNKDNAAEFQRWIDFLSGLGYKSTWHDLNAKDFGVPQQRVRTFMFSILDGSYSYVWPKPIVLEKRLKDILEDHVDEKYYIGGERAKKLIDNLIEREVLKSTDDHQVPVDGTLNEPNIKTVANALDAKDRGIDVRKCVRNVVVQNVE